jgi:hypothetical protein
MEFMNSIIHIGNEDSAPSNSFTDEEFDMLLQAVPLLAFSSPHLSEASNKLHTKLLFNRLNFVRPNTAITHADPLGEVTEYAVIVPNM